MAQTLVSLMVHLIFSTKNREPIITREIEPELFAYVGGITPSLTTSVICGIESYRSARRRRAIQ